MKRVATWAFYAVGALAMAYLALYAYAMFRGQPFVPAVQSPDSKALFEGYQSAARDAGLTTLQGEFSGGCADSGFTAAVGTPTICGLGPVGGLAHTPEEYLEIDSIVPRAQALALAILRG